MCFRTLHKALMLKFCRHQIKRSRNMINWDDCQGVLKLLKFIHNCYDGLLLWSRSQRKRWCLKKWLRWWLLATFYIYWSYMCSSSEEFRDLREETFACNSVWKKEISIARLHLFFDNLYITFSIQLNASLKLALMYIFQAYELLIQYFRFKYVEAWI